MPEIFKNLALDAWYKALAYVGGVVLVFALFFTVHGISNTQAQLLALGLFLIGLGEWKNHKTAAWFKEPNVYTGGAALMSTIVRKADAFGIFLDVSGLLSLGAGGYSILAPLLRT